MLSMITCGYNDFNIKNYYLFFWIITAAWRNEIIKNYLVVALIKARPSFNQQQHQQHNNEISVLLKCSTTTSTLMMVLIIMIIKWKNSGWNSNPVERISFTLWILMFIICFVFFFWISSFESLPVPIILSFENSFNHHKD